jgi:uncharacterized DUF497 family protein
MSLSRYTEMTFYTWDEAKRKSNLRSHGLDFADCGAVIEANSSYTLEDKRFLYSERRFICIGFSKGQEISITYTETNHAIRIISARKANRAERKALLGTLQSMDASHADPSG